MPLLSNIVILDGESTPVEHTFKPVSKQSDGVSTFTESDGVSVGDNVITVSSRVSNNNRKVVVRLRMPMTATQVVNGMASEVVTRTLYAETTFRFPDTCTTQERVNIVTLMKALLQTGQNPDLVAVLTDNEEYY